MKKIYILIVIPILFIFITFATHSILIKTSNTYNEILDKRAFAQLENSFTDWEMINFQIYSNTEELDFTRFDALSYKDGLFYTDMEYHSSKWNSPDFKWTHRVRVENRVLLGNGKISYDTKVFLSDGSDLFSIYYNDRLFYVYLPNLKKLIDYAEARRGIDG